MDLFSRKILDWAIAPGMPAELVASALRMAIWQRKPAPGLLLHFDRGSQYASLEYQSLLDQHGIRCSMSRKGNCWDTQGYSVYDGALLSEPENGTCVAT